MSNLSRLTITGNLTRDPEQKTTSGGRNLIEFTVANGRWRRKEGVEQPTFYRVTVWNERDQAYIMARAQRGTAVVVTGDYDQAPRDDGKGVFNDISSPTVELGMRQRGQQPATQGDTPQQAVNYHPVDNDDDIPF